MGKFLLMKCVFLCVFIEIFCENVELVQILFRHGDRNPHSSYTNDPYKDYPWPGGYDQLTNKGKAQLYALGSSLKERYKNVLDDKYDVKKVLIYTSYADRCHMSAQSLLASLYPPVSDQIWNSNLLWQPIPVHEIPRNLDNKIALKRPCAKYDLELKNIYDSDKVQEINKVNADLYKYLSKHTGDNVSSVLAVELLYNTLEIQKTNNLELPSWAEEVFPNKMKDLALTSLALFTETEYMKRMHGGMLIKEMIDGMIEKANNNDPLQLKLYSGHDLTLVSILNCLGLELMKPQFGASLIFELYKDEKYFVRVLLKENPNDEPKILNLPSCKNPCELEDFQNGLLPILPVNWDEECLIK